MISFLKPFLVVNGQEDVVKDFLEAVLNLSIQSVELERETILLPQSADGKTGVLDLKVILHDGTQVDIEMQNSFGTFLTKRALFYASRLYDRQLTTSDNYAKLNHVIVIFIANFTFLRTIPDYHTRWLFTEQTHKKMHLDDMELHFIELPKFLASHYDISKKLDQWLLFLDYSRKDTVNEIMAQNATIEKANQQLERMKEDEYLQELAWSQKIHQLDINTSYIEGVMAGEKKGERKGKREGRREGRREGEKEGEKKGQRKIAKVLLHRHMSLLDIHEITGLSQKEIEKIQESMGL